MCCSPCEYGYNGHSTEEIPSQQEWAEAPVHQLSTSPEPDWSRFLPTDPQTGITMLWESGQPDHHTPCWVSYWQHHFSHHMDASCQTHKMWMYIWFVWFKNSSVYCTVAKTASWNRTCRCYHPYLTAECKINGGLGLEYCLKLKRLFMQLKWGGICSFYVYTCISIVYFIFYFVRWN